MVVSKRRYNFAIEVRGLLRIVSPLMPTIGQLGSHNSHCASHQLIVSPQDAKGVKEERRGGSRVCSGPVFLHRLGVAGGKEPFDKGAKSRHGPVSGVDGWD